MATRTNKNYLRAFLDDVRRVVECPICLTAPTSSPIYRCSNGHLVCNMCRPNLRNNQCPTCKVPIRYDRCLISEKLIESLPVPCKFEVFGCNVETKREKLNDHETKCLLRTIQCPVFNSECNSNVQVSMIFDHFKTAHGRHNINDQIEKPFPSMKGEIRIPPDIFNNTGDPWWYLPHYLVDNGHTFFVFIAVKAGFCYSWVSVLNPAAGSNTIYNYQFILYSIK